MKEENGFVLYVYLVVYIASNKTGELTIFFLVTDN